MSNSSSFFLYLATAFTCVASPALAAPPAEKPHVKEVKALDAKAIENEVLNVAHEGSSQLDPKIYDNKGLEITVDCQKQSNLKLNIYWFGTSIGKEKKEHVWLSDFNKSVDLQPDAKGLATVHSNVVHFAKDISKVKEAEVTTYVFEGWALYLMDASGKVVGPVKSSSAAVEKALKDIPKN